MKYEYTADELEQMAALLTVLTIYPTKVVSPRADAVLHVGGEETPFALLLADDGSYYLSLVVPL